MDPLFPLKNMRRVYCAGPLFNAAERQEMLRIANVLNRGGFETFVPHADGMEFAHVRPYLVARGHGSERIGQWLHEAIFALDTFQVVVRCGSLVFNMNGRTPDEGAVAESTMAWMLGKPIVIFKDDCRSAVAGRDNPLVVGPAGFETVRDLERLVEALAAKIAAQPLLPDWRVPCPPHLADVLAVGQRLWNQVESLGADRDPAPVAELMLQLFNARDEAARDERPQPAEAPRRSAHAPACPT